jgi:hypothetical protein
MKDIKKIVVGRSVHATRDATLHSLKSDLYDAVDLRVNIRFIVVGARLMWGCQ